jgi:4-amino-4-deoxy-L-arabinose transferase-like glycosyltransferase
MTTPDPSQTVRGFRKPLLGAAAIVAILAAVKLLVHLATATNYGPFGDELYFLAAGEHLAWGYVDFPPLTAVQAWLARALFGESLFGIHLFPALLGAGLVLLTGLLVHELGGKRFAQALAGLAVLTASIYLYVHSYLSMNSVEPLIWMGCAWVLIRMIKTRNTKLWLAFGGLAGLGLLNKHTMLLFGAAVIAGVLLTPARRLLWSKWLLLGGALAFLIFLPNLVWMVRHDFPFFELLAQIRSDRRNVALSPLQFMLQQVIWLNPLTAPIWLVGLGWFFAGAAGKVYRALAWAYLITLALLLVTDGRVYYLAPAYPMLFAGGAVAIEGWAARRRWGWLKPAYLVVLIAGGLILAPFWLPLLPPQTYIRYAKAVPLGQPAVETASTGALPQLFADRFGWPEMAQATAAAYQALPPDVRAVTAIWGNNYAQGGAIDFYGPALGLPKAISGHLNYWYWGPRGYTGESVLTLGEQLGDLAPLFEKCEQVAKTSYPYAMPRNRFPIYWCRGMKGSLQELWPAVKKWD